MHHFFPKQNTDEFDWGKADFKVDVWYELYDKDQEVICLLLSQFKLTTSISNIYLLN